jgi:hypothetical protein
MLNSLWPSLATYLCWMNIWVWLGHETDLLVCFPQDCPVHDCRHCLCLHLHPRPHGLGQVGTHQLSNPNVTLPQSLICNLKDSPWTGFWLINSLILMSLCRRVYVIWSLKDSPWTGFWLINSLILMSLCQRVYVIWSLKDSPWTGWDSSTL